MDKKREKVAGKKQQRLRERNFLCKTGRPVWGEHSELRDSRRQKQQMVMGLDLHRDFGFHSE